MELDLASGARRHVEQPVQNLRTHGPGMFTRFNTRQAGTLWYCGRLADVLGRHLPGPLTRDLVHAVAEMRQLAAG